MISGDPRASMSRFETAYYLHNTLLRDGDVFSMASAMEVRVPFLDRDVMDLLLSLPGEVIVPDGKPVKHLLREACKDLYTPEIENQPKRGFVVPLKRWMQGPLRDTVQHGLEVTRQSGLVDPKGVSLMYDLFCREPESPIWSRLWALVMLGHWLDRDRQRSTNGLITRTEP